MSLVVHELIHFTLGLGVGLVCYFKFNNPWLILVALFFGFLIDVDHLFDYFAFRGFHFNIKEFMDSSYFCPSGHLFIPFHTWEWLGILVFFSRIEAFQPLTLTIAVAFLGHLLIDQITNSMHWAGYSIIFRALNRFNINRVSFGCKK